MRGMMTSNSRQQGIKVFKPAKTLGMRLEGVLRSATYVPVDLRELNEPAVCNPYVANQHDVSSLRHVEATVYI